MKAWACFTEQQHFSRGKDVEVICPTYENQHLVLMEDVDALFIKNCEIKH